jgi:hypothetical protein
VFSGVELLPGWLVTKDKGEVAEERFTWEERTERMMLNPKVKN